MKRILIVGLFLIGSIAGLIYSFEISLIVLSILFILTMVLILRARPAKSNRIPPNIAEKEPSTSQEEVLLSSKLA